MWPGGIYAMLLPESNCVCMPSSRYLGARYFHIILFTLYNYFGSCWQGFTISIVSVSFSGSSVLSSAEHNGGFHSLQVQVC